MILVRDVFQLHFGKAREAIALAKEGREIERRLGYPVGRILTDVVGEYYTLVFETEMESLEQMETGLAKAAQDPEWKDWFGRFQPFAQSGRREVFRIVG